VTKRTQRTHIVADAHHRPDEDPPEDAPSLAEADTVLDKTALDELQQMFPRINHTDAAERTTHKPLREPAHDH
jgi:hypothetical protein